MKRLWSLCLGIILCASFVLSGCSGIKEEGQKTDGEKPAQSSDTKGTVSAPGQLPVVKEKITLRIASKQEPSVVDLNTNEHTQFLEQKTNVHIQWEQIPTQALKEKVSLLLASGDYPDVLYGCGINPDQEAQYGVNEKVFIPLDELIEKHGVETKKLFQEYPGSQGLSTSTDGKIYSLPMIADCYHCRYSSKMWMNKVWLDKLSLKIPTTTEEFYQVLKAFKEKDPNGNGEKDELPLTGSPNTWRGTVDLFLMNAFVYYDLNSNTAANPTSDMGFFVKDGKVDTALNKSEFREGLGYLRKLYKEGLIFEGSFTQNQQQLTQLVENPGVELVGAVPGGSGLNFSKAGGERYRQFVPITPLKGPNGFQGNVNYAYSPVSTGQFVITKACKYPEVALRWADFQYTEEATMRSRRGVPEKSWRPAKPGETGIDGKPAKWFQIKPWQSTEPQNESYVQTGLYKESNEMRLGQNMDPKVDMFSADGLEKLLYVATKEKYEPVGKAFEKMTLPPVRFLKQEQDELITIRTEYGKFAKESIIKFIVGDMDIEKEWDKYVEGLNRSGLEKILKSTQTAYDRQFKK